MNGKRKGNLTTRMHRVFTVERLKIIAAQRRKEERQRHAFACFQISLQIVGIDIGAAV